MTAPTVATCLWYDTAAEEAVRLYVSLLPGSRITHIQPQISPDGKTDRAFLVEFVLAGQHFVAMNGGPHYRLNPAASIQVCVETQAEIDQLWDALLAGGGEESRCGWLTDRFGLSWQILPFALPRLAAVGGASGARVIQAMMGMVKLDIAALSAAARG